MGLVPLAGFGRYRKLITTGLINQKDSEATVKKAEQLALDSSTRLANYLKMGAYSYTLPIVLSHHLTAKQVWRGVQPNLLQSTLLLLSPGGLAARAPLTSAVEVRVLLLQEL